MRIFLSVVFLLTTLLAGCGTAVEGGLVFHTADPSLSIFVPVSPAPAPAPTNEDPVVIPQEEVGEILPNPTPPPPCEIIKGNISTRTGEKIYHVPGGANYDQVKIDESAGERFFCTEEEAVAAGWRKAGR